MSIYRDRDTACRLEGARPEHLLWALLFLKLYELEPVNASLARCDEKTFRKWSWLFVEAIGDLDYIYVSIFYIIYYICCSDQFDFNLFLQ